MLTYTVCSFVRLLFSRFRRCLLLSLSAQHVFKLPNQVLRIQLCVSTDFYFRQSRNCPHNFSGSKWDFVGFALTVTARYRRSQNNFKRFGGLLHDVSLPY